MANEKDSKDSKEKKPKATTTGGGAPGGKPAADNKPSKSKRKQIEAKVRGPHAGAALPVPPPRLKAKYESQVRPKLMEQFGFTNPHQVPTLTKIAINVGVGEAIKQPKVLDVIVEEIATITGQAPIRKKAKKSIANYGLRQGQEIGVAVTLRGAKMWEFMDRFISVAVPRIRDFKGMSTRSFDGRGNYSLGIKEQMIFPEINYDEIDQIHGMDITFVTSVNRDDQAHALLKALGMPFRTDEKASKKAVS